MRAALLGLSLAIAGTASGCMMGGHAAGGMPPAQPVKPQAQGMGAMQMNACPVAVPGTRLATADTPEGIAVTFTTSADRAEELRARVHAMADMHNREHQAGAAGGEHEGHGAMMGGMAGGMMGGAGGAGGMAMPMPPPSRATVEDVEGGATLSVAPYDPADTDRLRSTVRMHAEQMQQTGTCAM